MVARLTLLESRRAAWHVATQKLRTLIAATAHRIQHRSGLGPASSAPLARGSVF